MCQNELFLLSVSLSLLLFVYKNGYFLCYIRIQCTEHLYICNFLRQNLIKISKGTKLHNSFKLFSRKHAPESLT